MTKQSKLPQYLGGFVDYIDDIKDHRASDNCTYTVAEIIFLTVVAIFANCNGWDEIEEFGKVQIDLLREYLPYKTGTPSDDTLRLFFRRLDGNILSQCLASWMKETLNLDITDLTIALDGKSLCGSKDGNTRAIHTISAYVTEKNITLTQMQVDCKTNEITAAPELLDLIDIKGAVVTGDAMNCQTEITKKIREKEGDYLIAVKGNQVNLHSEIITSFDMIDKNSHFKSSIKYDFFASKETNRGRIERRECEIIEVDDKFGGGRWQDLKTIIRVKSQIEYKSKTTKEERYYIGSRNEGAKHTLKRTRNHWGIESNHYILDVSFKEDSCQISQGNAPFNIGIIRRFTLNIIQDIKPKNLSIALFRKSAGWDKNKIRMFIDKLINI